MVPKDTFPDEAAHVGRNLFNASQLGHETAAVALHQHQQDVGAGCAQQCVGEAAPIFGVKRVEEAGSFRIGEIIVLTAEILMFPAGREQAERRVHS